MKITDFIPAKAVFCEVKANDKWSFFSEVARALSTILDQSPKAVEKALVERERLSTTAIGNEVAIPHSRLAGLDHILVAVARKKAGLDFDALDKRPVKLIFVVLAPESEANIYLKTLAYLARLLSDEDVKNRLIKAASEKEILKILSEVNYDY